MTAFVHCRVGVRRPQSAGLSPGWGMPRNEKPQFAAFLDRRSSVSYGAPADHRVAGAFARRTRDLKCGAERPFAHGRAPARSARAADQPPTRGTESSPGWPPGFERGRGEHRVHAPRLCFLRRTRSRGGDAMSTTAGQTALRDRPAYQALEDHHARVREVHLRAAVRRRSGARHAPDRGGRGAVPRLLQEPRHRRDAAPARRARRAVRPARAHRRDVLRRAHQRHRGPRRAARRAARAARTPRSWSTATDVVPEVHAVLDRMARVRRRRPQRRVDGPHRAAHPQRRQHRHRRLRPRARDGLRGAAPLQRRAS